MLKKLKPVVDPDGNALDAKAIEPSDKTLVANSESKDLEVEAIKDDFKVEATDFKSTTADSTGSKTITANEKVSCSCLLLNFFSRVKNGQSVEMVLILTMKSLQN